MPERTTGPVVGRFAPSPSGRMHLGNVFSLMLAWLSARSEDGEIVLRIEDLDTVRCRPEYAELLRDDLRWLGLDWDRETTPQRERSEAYGAILLRLQETGWAYPCWCTRGQLHAASAPHASDGHWIYPGTCRHLTPQQRAEKTAAPSWRLIVPDRVIEFTDGLYGPQREALAIECGDFIIRKSDGLYAYQLAVVADDIACGVTQVVRGRDLLGSTARQIWLYQLLGGTVPEYYHVPLLLAPDGRRLSKRDMDLDLGEIRERLTPAQLLGFLAHAAGLIDRREPVSAGELAEEFSWDSLSRADITPDLSLLVS